MHPASKIEMEEAREMANLLEIERQDSPPRSIAVISRERKPFRKRYP